MDDDADTILSAVTPKVARGMYELATTTPVTGRPQLFGASRPTSCREKATDLG